jgi:group I intron endonuclease
MKKLFGIIYKVTNRVNGKVYIGQTIQPLSRRKGEHTYRFTHKTRDHLIYKAFEKHGFYNFTWEIVMECESAEELNQAEIRAIEWCNSYKRGYNMTPGGDAVSEETRAKLSEVLTGRDIRPWAHKIVATRRARGNYYGPDQKHTHIGVKGAKNPRSNVYVITEPNGMEHIVKGLRAWCRGWEKEALNHPGLIEVARGRRGHHKGYLCRYANQERSTTIPKGSTLKRAEAGSIPAVG